MFPTSGYFKNIPCPYYSNGACERPYCHFKHQRPSSSSHKTPHIPSYSTVADHNVVGALYKGGSTHSAKAKGKSRSAHRSAALPMLQYQHEPFPTGPSIPVYKPTPIAELNRMHGTQKKKDLPTSSEAVISAQFQVIGQGDSSLPPATSAVSGDGDGPPGKYDEEANLVSHKVMNLAESSNNDCSLTSSEDKNIVSPKNSIQQSTEGVITNSDVQQSTEGVITNSDVQQSTESVIADSDVQQSSERSTIESSAQQPPSKSLTITINTKRKISKKERREFAALFGDASDDEVDRDDRDEDSENDVVEVPPIMKAETVINLLTDSGEEDSDWEEVIDQPTARLPIPRASVKSETKSTSRRDSRKESSRSAKSGAVAAPITVTSSSNTGQCKELFEMFEHDAEASDTSLSTNEVAMIDDEIETSRKRKARNGAKESSLNTPAKKKKLLTPQEGLHNRFEAIKQAAKQQGKQATEAVINREKRLRNPDYNSLPDATASRTYKGQSRIAHEPKSQKAKKSLERPRIPVNSKSKIGGSVRQLKLDQLINECLRWYTDEADAYDRAKTEEEAASARATSKIIYYNLISNIIKNIREELGDDHANKAQPTVSHEVVLAGKASSKFTVGLKRKASTKHLTRQDMLGDLLFKKLRSYVLSENQLVEQGYPRPAQGKAGHADIQWTHYDKIPEMKGLIRICKRCGRSFLLTEDNGYVSKEECVYHWGKNFRTKVHGQWENSFTCCDGKPGSEGCTMSYGHVHESNKFSDLGGYMKTFAKKSKDYCGVYSLDCEMV
ncbi:RNA exonuclease 1 homolog isoform X2 [Watersipora subatra]